MNRWLVSIKLIMRRLFNERPARAIELENVALRARLNWLRRAIESQRANVLDGVPPIVVASELQWMLEKDAEAATLINPHDANIKESLNERTA